MRLQEGELSFEFAPQVDAFKYDATPIYLKYLQKLGDGTKGVDLIALSGADVWLIEVKDYRSSQRTNPSPFEQDISQKVRDTLAGLYAMRAGIVSGGDYPERGQRALEGRLFIVFHLEQQSHSPLFPPVALAANLQIKLRALLKPFTRQVWVLDRQTSQGVAVCWTVSHAGANEEGA